MPEFVLQPARLRETKFALQRGVNPVTMDWSQLRDRFAPSRSKIALMLLRQIKPGTFVGTRRKGDRVSTFIMDAAGCSRDIGRQLRADPNLVDDIVEVFLVATADWDVRLFEAEMAPPNGLGKGAPL